MNALLNAFADEGLAVAVKEHHNSSTINSLYGCIGHYEVLLDDHLVVILEYDLKNLDSTGERYLAFVDENGYDSKTDDPAWHRKEFLMRNTASWLENGEVKQEYKLKEHPNADLILEVFTSFD